MNEIEVAQLLLSVSSKLLSRALLYHESAHPDDSDAVFYENIGKAEGLLEATRTIDDAATSVMKRLQHEPF